MRIRRLKLSDVPRVMQIERASFGGIGYSSATFLAHLFRDRKSSFVAEDEAGAVIGYALVRMNLGWLGGRRGGITSIAVDPRQRRRGIGRALLRRALDHLVENDVPEADLEVEVSNRAAQSLYQALGFRTAQLLPHYYGSDRDGMRMVAGLACHRHYRSARTARADRAADG